MPFAFHGLAAFSGTPETLSGLLEKATRAVTCGGEIAVADTPIGPIGLVATGNIRKVFSKDCWSLPDDRGIRHATDNDMPYESYGFVSDADWMLDHPGEFVIYPEQGSDTVTQASLELFAREVLSARANDRSYVEGFMLAYGINAVWINPTAYGKKYPLAIRFAESLATLLNVPILDVKTGSRIWDVPVLPITPVHGGYDNGI